LFTNSGMGWLAEPAPARQHRSSRANSQRGFALWRWPSTGSPHRPRRMRSGRDPVDKASAGIRPPVGSRRRQSGRGFNAILVGDGRGASSVMPAVTRGALR
jgi:hypothetical protein